MNNLDLLGTWRLEHYKVILEDGNEIHPFGQDAEGYLIYTATHVSVHVMRADRPKQPLNPKLEMAENYNGYIGTYEIGNATITHFPTVSLHLFYTTVPQVRQYHWDGKQLILACPYYDPSSEVKGTSQLAWKKIDAH